MLFSQKVGDQFFRDSPMIDEFEIEAIQIFRVVTRSAHVRTSIGAKRFSWLHGYNRQIGDVIGSGTVSGPGEGEAGALIELSKAGNVPVRLDTGEERAFLEDGDTVILAGYCVKEGFARIGFGECAGEVLPAPTP
jgi:hypothetical protein